MDGMTEIAGTGFFFRRSKDGQIVFARMAGDEMEELDPETFANLFGSEVESSSARKQAQSILSEMNSSRRTNYQLAEPKTAVAPEDQERSANAMLGQIMGSM